MPSCRTSFCKTPSSVTCTASAGACRCSCSMMCRDQAKGAAVLRSRKVLTKAAVRWQASADRVQ